MNERSRKARWVVFVVGVVTLGLATAVASDARDPSREQGREGKQEQDRSRKQTVDDNRSLSDQDQVRAKQKIVEDLEALPVGRDQGFYWDALQQRGYRVIEEKINTANRLRLDAAKPGQAVTLSVRFDKETGKSTDVTARTLWVDRDARSVAMREAEERHTERMAKQPQSRRSREHGQRDTDQEQTGMTEDERWRRSKATLEQQLQPGQTLNAYRDQLANLGWRITAINNDEPDYVEYEVVKGDLSYEVQLRLNEETAQVTKVAVTSNTILAPATERALARSEQMERLAGTEETTEVDTTPWWQSEGTSKTSTQGHRFSDRDQTKGMVKQLEALPTGKDKNFYRQELQQQGYDIVQTNTDNPEELDVEVLKNSKRLALTVSFDQETGKSTAVEASRVWWAPAVEVDVDKETGKVSDVEVSRER